MDTKPQRSGRDEPGPRTREPGDQPDAQPSETRSDADGSDREVTFRTGPAEWAERAAVVADFNGWSTDASPMERRGDHFELTMALPAGCEYRYRVLLDGHHWDNDPEADAYVPNDYGSEDSVRRS